MAIPSRSAPHHDLLIRKLESIACLSEADREALRSLPLSVRQLEANDTVVLEGDHPDRCCLLISGFMHRYKTLPDGNRQVLSYHLPGDIIDLESLHLRKMDHAVGVIVPSQIGVIPHAAILEVTRTHPGIAAAFWRDTLIDAAIFREWIANVGARPARSRVAHLLCELYTRLLALGLADQDGFTLRLTQAEIGDATGLSSVHINRTLQDLRRAGLIASEGRFLRILDWAQLQQAAAFDPTYLHLTALSDA